MTLNNVIRAHPGTTVGLIAALAILALTFIANIEVLRVGIRLVQSLQPRRLDDFLLAAMFIITGIVIDQWRDTRRIAFEMHLQEDRLRVLKATMRTVHDIVNNCLNQLQLVRFEAEDGSVSHESLTVFDEAIRDTTAKLKASETLTRTRSSAWRSGPV